VKNGFHKISFVVGSPGTIYLSRQHNISLTKMTY